MRNIVLFGLLFLGGSAYGQATKDFVFTVDMASAASFTLPTTGTGYSYTVDWGDGAAVENVTTGSSPSHSYTVANSYTVRVSVGTSGAFPRIYFNNVGNKLDITTIVQWGSAINWTSFESAFYGCANLTIQATDAPILTNTTNTTSMFQNCSSITTGNFGAWDTHTITNMSNMFSYAFKFNENIGTWNTAAVTDMGSMFNNASVFDQNLGGWSTGAVTNMNYMFQSATAFNNGGGTGIGTWNTTSITNMSNMFEFASAFNQDIGTWNTAAVTDMDHMFYGASVFDQNIGIWRTDAVTDMGGMFQFAIAFNNGGSTSIGTWNTAAVTNMGSMFNNASAFNQNIGTWNTAAITAIDHMFYSASVFNQNISGWITDGATSLVGMFQFATAFNNGGSTGIGAWNTAAVTDMSNMFYGASVFNQNIGGWITGGVKRMGGMFRFATAYNNDGSADIGTWNTSAVTDMGNMFDYASTFNQDISTWNTGFVTVMDHMFYNASAFNQNIGGWITDRVTNFGGMFQSAAAFNNGGSTGIGTWNTTAVTDMSSMFNNAIKFNQNIGSWNTGAVTNMNYMFLSATAFNNGGSTGIGTWNTAAVTNMGNMFAYSSAFNQNIGAWNTAAVTDMTNMFFGADVFDQNIGGWSTSAVTGMAGMFQSAIAFNNGSSSGIGTWNTAAVTDMSSMFNNASMFNQNVGGWNTGAVTNMDYMFLFATAFNNDIGTWNIGAVASMKNMLDFCGLTIANYDATLFGWQASAHKTGISLGASGLKYCSSLAQRSLLTGTSNWSINGDTYAYSATVPTLLDTDTQLATSIISCIDATGYLQFTNSTTAPTAKYVTINPNGNTGYSFSVIASNNSPMVGNQSKTDGISNTTALANRMYTIADAGTDNYPSGMTVRIYYDPADITAATSALDAAVMSPSTGQWFKYSGSLHADNVAAILTAQTFSNISGATFLTPSTSGTENGIAYVEFSGITNFSTFGYLAAKTSYLLPITLVGFTATANGCQASINWHTSNETNSSYYSIEKGSPGSTFAQVGRVDSKNSATGGTYTYRCPLVSGTSFFRLKAVDKDGRFTYGPVAAVVGMGACSDGLQASVSPNPTRSIVNIQGLAMGKRVYLMDANGREIWKTMAASTSLSISLEGRAAGIYILRLEGPSGIESIKILKQ